MIMESHPASKALVCMGVPPKDLKSETWREVRVNLRLDSCLMSVIKVV